MLIVIIRDGDRPSLKKTKAGFVAAIFKTYKNARIFYVCRKEEEKFTEKWSNSTLDLATSRSGIFQYFTLMRVLNTPKELRNSAIRRICGTERVTRIRQVGFLTLLSEVLYQYFGRSARANRLIRFLIETGSKKVFLIDGFFALNTISLKKLKELGSIIYVSSDLAYDFYGDSPLTSKLMLKFEQAAITLPDMVIACSERDRLKYMHIGAKKVIFYPNIYPITGFKPSCKDSTPCVCIVLKEHWGSKAEKSLKEVLEAIASISGLLKVNLIGIKPQDIPKNIRLNHIDYIESKFDFLRVLSTSWFGINLGVHAGGTNERKYDYAMAGLVVLSDNFGVRGDLLPYEYSYFDRCDLTAKLLQLIELGKERITEMGMENRKQALVLAETKRKELSRAIDSFLLHNIT